MQRFKPALGLLIMMGGIFLVVLCMVLVKRMEAINPAFTVVELLVIRGVF